MRIRGAAAAAAEVKGLSREFKGLGASAAAAGRESAAMDRKMAAGRGALATMGKVARVGALGLVGLGLEAVKASTQFNHEMLKIRTDAGASSKELAYMKTHVLALAASGASMGQGPMSLAQGLYHLESLGIRGKAALHALALASQEAAISGSNLEETVSALGSVIYVGIKGAGNLDQVMAQMNATIGTGNMRMGELVHALGTGVLSSAKVAGLSFQDVTAALAVFSDSGQNASSAAAQFATSLHFLYAPTTKAQAALKGIGMTSTQLAIDLHKPQGMVAALKDLRDHLKGLGDVKAAQVLNAILPGGRGRILLTELTMLDRAMAKYQQQAAIKGGFGGSVALQRQDPTTRLHMGVAALQANLVRMGNAFGPIILPVLGKLLQLGAKVLAWLTKLPAIIKSVVAWWKQLPAPVREVIRFFVLFAATAVVILKVVKILAALRLAFLGILIVSRLFIATPLGLAIMAISAVLVLMITHWKEVKRVVLDVWKWVSNATQNAWSVIKAVLTPFIAQIQAVITVVKFLWQNVFQPIAAFVGGALSTQFNVFKAIVLTIGDAFKVILAPIKAAYDALNSLGNLVGGVGNAIGGAFSAITGIGGSTVAQGVIPSSVGTGGGLPPLNTPTSNVGGGGAATGGHRAGDTSRFRVAPVARVKRSTDRASAGWGTGDIVLKVGPEELARIVHRQVQLSMARGA